MNLTMMLLSFSLPLCPESCCCKKIRAYSNNADCSVRAIRRIVTSCSLDGFFMELKLFLCLSKEFFINKKSVCSSGVHLQ